MSRPGQTKCLVDLPEKVVALRPLGEQPQCQLGCSRGARRLRQRYFAALVVAGFEAMRAVEQVVHFPRDAARVAHEDSNFLRRCPSEAPFFLFESRFSLSIVELSSWSHR